MSEAPSGRGHVLFSINAVVFACLAVIAVVVLSLSMPNDMRPYGIPSIGLMIFLAAAGFSIAIWPGKRLTWILFGCISVMMIVAVFFLHRHEEIALPLLIASQVCFIAAGAWLPASRNETYARRYLTTVAWGVFLLYGFAAPFTTLVILNAISKNKAPALAILVPVVILAHMFLVGIGFRHYRRSQMVQPLNDTQAT